MASSPGSPGLILASSLPFSFSPNSSIIPITITKTSIKAATYHAPTQVRNDTAVCADLSIHILAPCAGLCDIASVAPNDIGRLSLLRPDMQQGKGPFRKYNIATPITDIAQRLVVSIEVAKEATSVTQTEDLSLFSLDLHAFGTASPLAHLTLSTKISRQREVEHLPLFRTV